MRAHTSVPPEVDVEVTCAAFHACAAEVAKLVRRHAPPLPSEAEIDLGLDDGYRDPDPKTLRGCALELDAIVQRAAILQPSSLPATCRATSAL